MYSKVTITKVFSNEIHGKSPFDLFEKENHLKF